MPKSPGTLKSTVGMDQDLNSPSCGYTPADLQNIREQMALSLERTKMVEELVKHVPLLQAQLAELKEEKRQLLLQIKTNKEENRFVNGALPTQSNVIPPLQKSILPHRRDFGITCSLLVPTESPHNMSYNWKVEGYADKWYKEKNNFLNDRGLYSPVSNSVMANKRTDTITVTKETQTTLPRNKKDSGIQTLNNIEAQSVLAVPECKKVFRSVGMTACTHTTDSCTEPVVTPVSTIGVSDDTIDTVLCIKCACRNVASKGTSTFHNQLNIELQNRTIGCQYNLTVRNASIQCETNNTSGDRMNDPKINVNVSTNTDIEPLHKKEYHTVSCQYECFSLHKTCQVDLKLKDKAVQHDVPFEIIASEFCSKCSANKNALTTSMDTSLNKELAKISLSSLTVPRSKSFCSIDTPAHRNIGCQYESSNVQKATQVLPKVKHKEAQCEDTSFYFTKFKTKLGPKQASYERESSFEGLLHKESEPVLKDDSAVVPSRIPRLQLTPENKKLRRQDTYNVDLSKTVSMLGDQIAQQEIQAQTFMPENAECEISHSSNNLCSDLQSYSEIHLQSNIERKKMIPSKSMKAALKVLSDCLKKGQTENLEDQLKNSINIVQLEWFKISSLIDANPLDVEDYLDFFEDISFNLLRYIVNMVDANGNTAMHYAVSHGNFNVVSILLDSKVCDINQTNKVGYTSVMLVSLVEIASPEHANVVRRIFKLADVNVKAKQHGQTALMLAVSHGRLDMVQMLLEAGADINIQDEDGSTALMCAAEHGHIEIVKLFLDQPECDSTIADIDGSTALTIAMEAEHRSIGVLLYTHQRIHRTSIQRSRSS